MLMDATRVPDMPVTGDLLPDTQFFPNSMRRTLENFKTASTVPISEKIVEFAHVKSRFCTRPFKVEYCNFGKVNAVDSAKGKTNTK
jgi:hypothetical protein